MASTPPKSHGEAHPSTTVTAKPFLSRLSFSLQLWAIRILAKTMARLDRHQHPLPPASLPTATKYYAPLQELQNRFFTPPSPLATKKRPLFISLHSGAFVLGDPSHDDAFNARLAARADIVVVSLNYRKAPRFKFPTALNDVATLVEAVLADESLNVDVDRVAIGGFSAGGNLALAVSQLPVFRGRLKAVVSWYPLVTFEMSPAGKLTTMPYRGADEKDGVGMGLELFEWAYLPVGTDVRDPLLSVMNAERASLPEWCYVIAAELDMLGNDSRTMMEKLMGEKDIGYEYEKGGLKFEMVRGVFHGFTIVKKSGKDEVVRMQAVEKSIDDVSDWLWKGPFA